MSTNKTELRERSFIVLPTKGISLLNKMTKAELIALTLIPLNKEKMKNEFNTYPFRKQVEIDEDKYTRDKELTGEYDFERFRACASLNTLLNDLFNPVVNRDKVFLNDKKLSYYDGLTRSDIVDKVFEEGNGVITFRHYRGQLMTVRKEDFETYLERKHARVSIKRFDDLVNKIGSRDYLPIREETTKYIKFPKGYSIVNFGMPKHNLGRKNVSSELIMHMITEVNKCLKEEIEIVDHSYTFQFIDFTILCKTEKIDDVLSIFSNAYTEVEKWIVEDDVHYTYISVTRDIGTENRENKWYQVFTGKPFDSIKESPLFEKQEELFHGFSAIK
ncbi:hypothetical protein ACQUY5_25100 [Bacillus cereus]|uniref:hypothetical protein n=1 Tax=Bacillus cereus TaxID=1396 RepID=UPI003D18225F